MTPADPGHSLRETAAGSPIPAWLTGDFALALLGAVVALAVSAALGFPKLAEPGTDNDSVMRLVQVRDLVAGQGWFDLHQYRMGTDGGILMHWSRLVDAPIAGLMLLLRPILGGAGAELAAAIIWPTALMTLALYFLLRATRPFGGEAARFPVLALGATALHIMDIFSPGSFDHHNLQLVLVLAVTARLVTGGTFATGFAAGAAAAASMAVGMETMPYVAAAGASVALLFLLRGNAETGSAAGFGMGLAAGAALCLALTVRPAGWFAVTCDAFSGAHAGSAILAGLGMAGVAALAGRRSRSMRLGALIALAAASAAFVLAAYPQCLADPYADLPARLRDYWLDWVSEAQSLRSLLANAPAEAATHYITPLIGLAVALGYLFRPPQRHAALPVAVLLAAATAVSIWQVRGAIFSISLSIIPLAAWIGGLRSRAAAAPSFAAILKMAAAWLVSFNVAWGTAVLFIVGGTGETFEDGKADACRSADSYSRLAQLPPGPVLTISNLGPIILASTPHRVLSGPYHRNVAGNLAMIDAMVGTPNEAHAITRRHDVAYVVLCPGNPETQVLARRPPDGFLARLVRNEQVGWLEPLEEAEDDALRIFRVTGR